MESLPFRHFEHVSNQRSLVVESYCPVCKVFIAASSNPKMLALAEQLHECPESTRFGAPKSE
jgi:hypothetical protein